MITAKLIKDLEKKGFMLDFPGYISKEDEILEILHTDNERLNLAIPLLLTEKFDYEKIIKKIKSKELIKKFNKLIMISKKIFHLNDFDNSHLKEIIKKHNLNYTISKSEFSYYNDSFKEAIKNRKEIKEQDIKEQIDMRNKLNINKALSILYSPGKIKIMKKIFNHEPLTNTELKYYYRSIRPIILAILNENLQKYVRIIESTKKYTL